MRSFLLNSRHIVVAFLVSSLFLSASAFNLDDYLEVEMGDGLDSCARYRPGLDDVVENGFALADAARTTGPDLQAAKDPADKALFLAVFGINLDRELGLSDAVNLHKIAGNLAKLDASYIKNLRPHLYCNSSFLIWTDTKYDKETLKKTKWPLNRFNYRWGAFWYPAKKAYTATPESKKVSRIMCSDNTVGFSLKSNNVMVLCPPLLNSKLYRRNTLDNFSSQNSDPVLVPNGYSIDGFMTISGAFLHELVHIINHDNGDQPAYDKNGNKISGEESYGYQLVMNLARKDPGKARKNPDSYVYWAIGRYLNQYSWATGVAAPRNMASKS